MSSNVRLRVGLVGFGVSARIFHFPFLERLSHRYEVKSIVERHSNDAKNFKENVKIVRSADELFRDPEIDLVVITTSNESHFSLSKQALEMGKHVVVEKPMTIESQQAKELIDLAKSQNLILCPYHNRRFTSGFRTVAQIVEGKYLGDEIVDCEFRFDRFRPDLKPGNVWREENRPGSGVFYDLGPHLIDQALTLFGYPKTITADIRIQREMARIDDSFDVRLDYGRLRVILKAGMLVKELGPRYSLHGPRGSFLKYGDDVQEEKLKAGEKIDNEQWGTEPEEQDGILHTESRRKFSTLKGDYGLFYEQLYEAIVYRKDLQIRPEDGYNVIRLIELAFQSNREKRTIDCDSPL